MASIKQILNLSFTIAKAGFKLGNEGSYLGIFWYLLNPLLTFVLLLLVFGNRLGSDIPDYVLYLLIGIIMFNFFQKVTTESTRIIIREFSGIIKSINFPKESLPTSVVIKTVFSHFFEMIIFIIFLVVYGNKLSGLIFYPVIFVFFCFFVLGASLILSALTVYLTDLDNVWQFISRLLWLGTPLFYDIGGQTRLFYFSLFNPLYYFITITRDVVIYSRVPPPWMLLGALLYSVLSIFIGLFIFNRLKAKFAELI